MVDNVVSLDSYRAHIKGGDITGESIVSFRSPVMKWVTSNSNRVVDGSGKVVSAERLYDTGDPDQMGRFFKIMTELILKLTECEEYLHQDDYFAADDTLMNCRSNVQQLFMLRDISEAVGLVGLHCVQAIDVVAISETPNIASALKSAVSRLRAAPFMKFESAMELVDELEQATSARLILPGYNELVNCLLDGLDSP